MPEYRRTSFKLLKKRLSEPRRFIQVLAGPRQVGKTKLATQLLKELSIPAHYVSADEPTLQDRGWLAQQWDIARVKATGSRGRGQRALLVLDEVQKVTGWSEAVKRLWDEDTANKMPLKVMLLGSSPLLMQKGLTESLAGRFEIVPLTHWSFQEMQEAFGWSIEQYVYFGGYPGSAPLIKDRKRWADYITNALIETSISRDILLMTRVDKPALLRRLFHLGCEHSGQVISYQKLVGQLQDAGNTTTLAHYLDLLSAAGLLAGLNKFAGERVRQRGSSPKMQVLNTGLMSALTGLSFSEAQNQRDYWGRLVESAVGAHLVNKAIEHGFEVFYWLDRNREVDFVVRSHKDLTAVEVKSGRKKSHTPGISAFCDAFPTKRRLLVGAQGIPIEEFLAAPVSLFVST